MSTTKEQLDALRRQAQEYGRADDAVWAAVEAVATALVQARDSFARHVRTGGVRPMAREDLARHMARLGTTVDAMFRRVRAATTAASATVAGYDALRRDLAADPVVKQLIEEQKARGGQ